MDIEKQIFNIFSSFIRDLSKTYPEIKNCLYRNYEDCILNDKNENQKSLSEFPKLKEFLNLIQKYESYITDKNSEFFDLEIDLLENISFQKLWSKNISGKTRESIWKYLQTFQIINVHLKSNEELKEALTKINSDETTELEIDKKTAKDLKKLKKLSEDVQEKIPEEESNLDSMLSGLMDSEIGGIAKEVAQNMNIEEMFGNINENSNPLEIMSQLMNPQKIGSIFNDINKVVDKKVNSGELSEDSLKKEAEGMCGKFSDNPLFGNLMKQMNPEESSDSQENNQSKDTQNNNQSSDSQEKNQSSDSKEENKEKLRKKIQEKKDKRT